MNLRGVTVELTAELGWMVVGQEQGFTAKE
jgi:hypothetical protein